MSILGSSSSSTGNMSAPFFQEIKRQASFFLKEKIKTARLALTDVTPAQLLAEEATNGNLGGPDTRILKMISRAAFEVDDYWRVVEILHKKLANFDKSNWRAAYKALIVLEHLLCHGPESVAQEFQSDKDVIEEIGNFQHIDEQGFNWGLNVRKKSERILKLLENRILLKEERNRARKITRGIEGFGSFSFCERTSSEQVLQESSMKQFERSNSQANFSSANYEDFAQMKHEKKMQPSNEKTADTYPNKNTENYSTSWRSLGDQLVSKNLSFKENMAPEEEMLIRHSIEWDFTGESNRLLDEQKVDYSEEADHPFSESEHVTTVSLLSAPERALRAC